MQYTANYNLNLPEGTDIVNPLVQDNPNYSTIDGAMYANKLRVIGTATELTTGTVHAITRADTDIPVFRFVATSDFNTGDTFTVDGVSVTARRADGAAMKNKAYVINSTVLCILDGTILNFIGVDGAVDSEDITFDNSGSTLTATDVENAIKEADDDIAWTDITSLCTVNASVLYPLVMYNKKMKMIKASGIVPAGVPNVTTLITFPAGMNAIQYQMITATYDNVKTMAVGCEIEAGVNYIRTAYGISTPSGVGFGFNNMIALS